MSNNGFFAALGGQLKSAAINIARTAATDPEMAKQQLQAVGRATVKHSLNGFIIFLQFAIIAIWLSGRILVPIAANIAEAMGFPGIKYLEAMFNPGVEVGILPFLPGTLPPVVSMVLETVVVFLAVFALNRVRRSLNRKAAVEQPEQGEDAHGE